MPPVIRAGRVPGGVPRFLAQRPSTPIPPGTFLPPVTGAVGSSVTDTNTVLLVHADGTNGSTSFTDSSSYAHTLTAAGSAQVTTSSPKFGTGSVALSSGVGHVDTGNSGHFNFGAGQFTLEAWAYFTAAPDASYRSIVSQWGDSPSPLESWWFGLDDASNLLLFWSPDGSFNGLNSLRSAISPALNTWYHLAADRDAVGVVRLYFNGTVITSSTVTTAFYASSATCLVGDDHNVGSFSFPGNLDDVRVSNVARYGGAFTPPIAPFTVSAPLAQDAQTLSAAGTVVTPPVPITGTLGPVPIASPSCVLLLHADGAPGSTTFVDSSLNAHALTPTSTTVTATSKFGGGAADFTASSSSVIDTGNATDFNFGAGAFTIETWAYFTANSSSDIEIISQYAAGNIGWDFYCGGGFLRFLWTTDGSTSNFLTGAYTPPLNTWVHLAVERDASNTLRIYVNGAVLNSVTVSSAFFASTTNCLVGSDGSGDNFTGYLDEVRVTKGRAMYGGAFTPATGPFSAPSTVLLMHFDGPNNSTTFTDSSLNANQLTSVAGAFNSAGTTMFGSPGALFLPGGASSVNAGVSEDFHFGAGPFTIEAWCMFFSNGVDIIAVQGDLDNPAGNLGWSFFTNSGNLGFAFTTNGANFGAAYAAFTPTLYTWYHLAVDRDATNTLRIYINGVVGTSPPFAYTIYPSARNTLIGNDTSNSTYAFDGYLDEVRITKGFAQYGGAFTPPAQAFLPGYTIGLTQADQTLSAAGTVGAGAAITGTLNVTEANDTIVAAGTVLVAGTLASTQDNQTLVATAGPVATATLARTQVDQTLVAVGAVPDNATLARTQDAQTLSATAGATVTGTLSITQAPQTLTATGADVIAGTLTATQADQTLSAFCNVGFASSITGTLTVTELPDTLAAAGDVAITGTLALTEQPDTLVAIGVGKINATLALTQDNHTLAATGANIIAGTLALTQTNHTLGAAASASVTGTLVITQADQTLTATASQGNTATLSLTQVNQILAATGTVPNGAALTVTQASQTLLATGTVLVSGALALFQDTQTLAGVGGSANPAHLALTQVDQTLSATAVTTITGTLSRTQTDQTLSAAGMVVDGIACNLNRTQADQTLAAIARVGDTATLDRSQPSNTLNATASVLVAGRLITTQDNQTLASTGFVLHGLSAALTLLQQSQILVATGTVSITGTLTKTQDNQTLNGGTFVSSPKAYALILA